MSVVRFGRSLFRSLFNKLPDLKASGRVPAKPGFSGHGELRDGHTTSVVLATRTSQNNASILSRHVWSGLTSRAGYPANTQAAFLRRIAASRLLRGCGPKAPVFTFLGFAYAGNNVKPPKEVQEKEQFKSLRQWIQETLCITNMAAQPEETVEQPSLSQLKLKDYEVGERLGEPSSSAAVYAAKYNGHEPEETVEQPSLSQLKLKDYEVGERLGEPSSSAAVYAAKYNGHEYALKMLFNFYGANSRSSSLHREFAKECQVLSVEKQQNTLEAGPSYTTLPPHPNILPILHAFCDDMPCLPDAKSSYPAALPSRYGNGCFARNRTMFLVMPRYSRTVQEFITSNRTPDPQVSSLLLLQLLEGITHLTRHGVAHRDLKTDNLLLDESTSDVCPHLVIADFGCCLADKRWGLKLPFITEEIDRGGNSVLMAPEIANAIPGEGAVLDYTKSDAWAAGAISYELFGEKNPFGAGGLDSSTYQDRQLPPLSHAPPGVRRVVSLLLKRNSFERVTADNAVTMLALVLWAPTPWLQTRHHISVVEIDMWLIGLSVRMLGRGKIFSIEDEILYRFLCRAKEEEITGALELLNADNE